MASSKTCFFLVFLCLVVLLIPKSAQAEGGGKPYIQGGPCSQFPDCNQHCIDLKFPGGGKCIKVGQRSDYLTCACFE
ncbi:putative defensin-like protein 29 [Brassica rapa]|uniref:Knottin scorpion toxin-like domain-containing protein n=2 Tax=Brassica TaxID=3705 RepID=A0A3P6BU47_BRACM|nr:putative defensin-like protein 29 [Brassica rapa]CAF2244056.1 unnamed protein product [Brassica napus]CAG7898545.1 unnamed protein product [Brassica rapa]CDY14226.1 BnaA08g13570D [Brassica napus]VDD05210.1 unnamed protein product [Brassica rapa]